jgi:hypothetical protein
MDPQPVTVQDNENTEPTTSPIVRGMVIAAAVITFIQIAGIGVFILGGSKSPVMRAVISMALGLVVFWIIIGGLLSLRFKKPIRAWVTRLPGSWQVKFVIFATVMALLEEAVTVTMTNCAPLFGVKVGQAYITASANYLDVVLGHSVIVFIPQFIAWAWLLSRYNLSPAVVFLIYGIQGITGEAMFGGPSHLMEVFWIFVYGLMVYLPAYCIPTNRKTRKLDAWIILYFLVVIISPGPMVAIVTKLHPTAIHFPPIKQ